MGMNTHGTPEVHMDRIERDRLNRIYENTAADFWYAIDAGLQHEANRLARQLERIGNKIGR